MAGLANSMLLFLVAAGPSLIFGISRIVNFAHGSIFMLGAYVAFTIVNLAGQSLPAFFLALVASTAFTFLFGVVLKFYVIVSPASAQMHLTQIIPPPQFTTASIAGAARASGPIFSTR